MRLQPYFLWTQAKILCSQARTLRPLLLAVVLGLFSSLAVGRSAQSSTCLPGESCMTEIPLGDRTLYLEKNKLRQLSDNSGGWASFCNVAEECVRCCDALKEAQPDASCSFDAWGDCQTGAAASPRASTGQSNVISLR